MYILDTNVFSELIKPKPDKNVLIRYHMFLNQIYLASPVWQELYYGWQIMSDGKKKQEIHHFIKTQVATLPQLHYTKDCADIHPTIRAEAKQLGKTLSYIDSEIASIAIMNNMTLITRNTKDFANITTLKIENWFE